MGVAVHLNSGSFLEKRTPAYPNKVSSDMPEFFPWWDEPEFK